MCDEIFKLLKLLKKKLVSVLIIKDPDWELPFHCSIDASQLEAEGPLTRATQYEEHAISYFFKRLSPAEKITQQTIEDHSEWYISFRNFGVILR